MKKKDILIILLLLLFTLPSVFPLVHHGFFQTDDGEWMIIRLSAFYQALHDGQFPIRFLQRLNFGYGYPAAEFLYPGGFYFASVFHIIRFGFVNSIKMLYGVSLICSAVFTYLWLRKLFTRFPSFIGALIALYVPYHLYDVYTRGSIEVFAILWAPFILWQIERRSIFWISAGVGLLLLSHNTMALLFLPLLFIYALLRKTLSIRIVLTSFFLGILLSSFFIIPAVFELKYTIFSQTPVSNPLLYFAPLQLIGISVLLILIATPFSFLIKNKVNNQYRSLTFLFLIVTLLTLFLSTPLSRPLWGLPSSSLIQFPFRILSYFVVSIAFLAAFIIAPLRKKQQWIAGVVLIIIAGYAALPYSIPVSYFDKGEGYYYTNDATTTVHDEYMPIWVKQKSFNRPNQLIVVSKTAGTISNIHQTNKSLKFVADLQRNSQVQVNIVYWPGWKATLDGKPLSISYTNPSGVMIVTIPKGQHQVAFIFWEDSLRLVSDVLSLLAFFVLLLLAWLIHQERQNKKIGKISKFFGIS